MMTQTIDQIWPEAYQQGFNACLKLHGLSALQTKTRVRSSAGRRGSTKLKAAQTGEQLGQQSVSATGQQPAKRGRKPAQSTQQLQQT